MNEAILPTDPMPQAAAPQLADPADLARGATAANVAIATSSAPQRRRSTDNEVVLIVDDAPENLSALGDLLQNAGYRVKVANSGHAALKLALKPPQPSLILLDIMMPDMDGHEVLRQLRSKLETRDIPVIFLTSRDTGEDEEWAFSAGVADYVVKPFRPAIILARVRSQILVRQARRWLVSQNHALETEVERRMRENEEIQTVSIRALAHLAETRDYETGKHIQRTQDYVRVLASHLANHPRFVTTLNPGYIRTLVRSAPLHDIGKVGIPDHILLKPGRLTASECEIMKTHTTLGSNAIAMAEKDAATEVGFLAQAKEIARWHHERWDGRGYPDGLSGESIPVSARLMALADVFDALISRRVYKEAFAFDQVRRIITGEQGWQFDPDAAKVFLAHWDEFEAIALHYGLDC